VKQDGGRTPAIVLGAAVLLVVIAVGAALQGRFNFGGPLWSPDDPQLGTQKPVTPTPQPPQTAAPSTRHVGSAVVFNWVPILVVLGILVAALVAFIIWRWARRRMGSGAPKAFSTLTAGTDAVEMEPEAAADLPTLRRGLDLAGDVLEREREPRDAIVRAWIGLQEAAEDSGMSRRPAETPTEFTSRVFSSVHADRSAADTLLAVYLRVRFGTHPATAEDVRVARDAVAALSATWPAEASK
jgi:hypothetical protein